MHKLECALRRTVILCAFVLVGCAVAQQAGSGHFRGQSAQRQAGTSTDANAIGVATLKLRPALVTGGGTTVLTVKLTDPAPNDGLKVVLRTSDSSVVSMPATIEIPSGKQSATATVQTLPVAASTVVNISAHSGNTMAGVSLDVAPEASAPFTISLHPATVTIKPGKSGKITVKTKISKGYDHSLTLSAQNVPTGVEISFNPEDIAAPGQGSSAADITVASSVAQGTYSIPIVASDGTHSPKATLKLKVGSPSKDPGASFEGCWYQSNGNNYQGVLVSVANPGTYPFNAILYYGTTCNPNDWADQIGFGEEVNFGEFDWLFWFSGFANQSDMSAQWFVGNDASACVNYEVAPVCP